MTEPSAFSMSYLYENGLAPTWMNEEGLVMSNRYCATGKQLYKDSSENCPKDIYNRVAKTAAKYMVSKMDGNFIDYRLTYDDFYKAFFECLWEGYISLATPVAGNFGALRTKEDGTLAARGLPISCYGLRPRNSIDGIFATSHECAMLSKNGGGLGVDLSPLIGESAVTGWAKLYDLTAELVSQGGLRRGSVALYLDVNHPEIEEFLHAKDMHSGDPREKLNCNIAITLDDKFFFDLKNGDVKARRIFSKILTLRMKHGSPYLFFVDNANRQRGIDYDALDLRVNATQQCAEIMLHSDEQHTYVCCLSSVVLSRWNQWRDLRWIIADYEWSVPALCIALLDAVTEEFLVKARNMPGLENAVRFSEKSRAVGMGVVGWHHLLQQHMIPFDSEKAVDLNKNIWTYLRQEAEQASLHLGRLFGVPLWCQASGQRNSHLLAVAPTLSSSVFSVAGSNSVEPLASNIYTYTGVNGNFVRRNLLLENELEKLGLNNQETWRIIIENNGSVQPLKDVLTRHGTAGYQILEVFKTAYEIDQFAILRQAADRQQYIDQGQSINLFIPNGEDADKISRYHIQAWRLGLKSLYYVRSTSPRKKALTIAEDKPSHTWSMEVRDNCSWCAKAKSFFQQRDIPVIVRNSSDDTGTVPKIWCDGNFIGGYSELLKYFNVEEVDNNQDSCPLYLDNTSGCSVCEG